MEHSYMTEKYIWIKFTLIPYLSVLSLASNAVLFNINACCLSPAATLLTPYLCLFLLQVLLVLSLCTLVCDLIFQHV